MNEEQPPVTRGMPLPNVIVYTHSLLAGSMTFIRSHSEAMQRHRAIYAGAHRIQGLALPEDRVVTANTGGRTGRASEYLFRRFGFAPGFLKTLRGFTPRIVHSHFGPSGSAALRIARYAGVPLVQTFHGKDATMTEDEARQSWRGREYLRSREDLIEGTAMFIAVSDFIRGKLLEQGFPEQKVVTHRNGIDVEYFKPQAQVRESVVVFVGRFVEKKGCEYLIRALATLRAQGAPTRGVLIGDGPLRASLERLVRETGAEVEFTGFVPLDQVRQWVGRAAVVAVPSVTASNGDSEGLPTVVLEAQAMGTPLVVSRHSGNPEGVKEGKTALLVDERDVEGLAAGIRFFTENPRAVEQFGTAAREFVVEQFSLTGQVAGLEDLYDSICVSRAAKEKVA